jgi:hypothetical protein
MAVAEASKNAKLADLNVDVSSLYRLASPKTPAEVIDAVAEGSARGESFTREQVDTMITAAADKMEALASYARQAHDETLHNYAKRIQGRAVRRTGELLKEIEPSKGRQPENVGAPLRFTRSQAAREAGLSTDQRNTALRVASIPPAEFEAAVESDKPPTVTELAEHAEVTARYSIAALKPYRRSLLSCKPSSFLISPGLRDSHRC